MSRAQGCARATTYRIALGPQAGRKVFTLQTLPACEPDDYADTAGKASGFSLLWAWRPGLMSARN
jgi:hypothetical protein